MVLKKLEDIENVKVTEEEIQKYLRDWARKELSKSKVLEQLLDGFAEIEAKEIRVTDVVMAPRTYTQLRKVIQLDTETNKTILQNGLMAMLWGANFWVETKTSIPEKEMRIYGEDDPSLETDFPGLVERKKLLKR